VDDFYETVKAQSFSTLPELSILEEISLYV
jgi:hypothetical protein